MIGPLSYVGGKRRLAKLIVSLLPAHTTYVEPFAGGAQVFFHKPRSRVEILNDIDNDVVGFLRCCQRHPLELSRVLRWQPASRRLLEWYLVASPTDLTDVERAARFFFLQKNAWGGRRTRQNFHYAVTKPANYMPAALTKKLVAAADRLANVQIEALSHDSVFERYDRPSTLFYCDPPYIGVDLYRYNFTDADFRALAARLARLQGRFLLSINDCPQAREWFGQFYCRTVSLTYSAAKRPQKFQELLFSNVPIDGAHLDTTPIGESACGTQGGTGP